MTIKFFRNVRFQGDWELDFIGYWSLRIGRSQIALWKNYNVIFQWLSTRAK